MSKRQTQIYKSGITSACDECLNTGDDCIKMVCLAWIMDSQSKNKNSQTSLNQNQKDNEDADQTDSTVLLTAFPDAVHVAKNDRASFANWYRLVDGYRVNLVLQSSNCKGGS